MKGNLLAVTACLLLLFAKVQLRNHLCLRKSLKPEVWSKSHGLALTRPTRAGTMLSRCAQQEPILLRLVASARNLSPGCVVQVLLSLQPYAAFDWQRSCQVTYAFSRCNLRSKCTAVAVTSGLGHEYAAASFRWLQYGHRQLRRFSAAGDHPQQSFAICCVFVFTFSHGNQPCAMQDRAVPE